MNIIAILWLGIIQMSCLGGTTNADQASPNGILEISFESDSLEHHQEIIASTISISEEENFKLEKPIVELSGGKSSVSISEMQSEMHAEKFDSKSNSEEVQNNSFEKSQELELEEKESSPEDISTIEVASSSEIRISEAKLKVIEDIEDNVETNKQSAPDHSQWNSLLGRYVDQQGRVNYAAFKKAEEELDKYLKLLAENPVNDSWSKQEALAYWINVYNAFTIKLILKNYPVKSIMSINKGKAWDLKWVEIGKQTFSLDEIENQIIRPRFQEPRIHFAVNCAAKSCPPLVGKAFTAENIESLLESQTIAFINDKRYNQISEKTLEVSKIFDWYKEDFGNLTDFINKYAEVKVKSGAKVSFNEYDWSLNN